MVSRAAVLFLCLLSLPASALGGDVVVPSPSVAARIPQGSFTLPDGVAGWLVSISKEPVPTPAYGDGKIFSGGGYGSRSFAAFDAKTGTALWTVTTADNGPTSPVVQGDYVGFNTESCHTEVISSKDGHTLWSEVTGSTLLTQPLMAENMLIVPHPNTGNGDVKFRMMRVSLTELKRGADTPLPADVRSAPIYANGNIFYATADGQLGCSSLGGINKWRIKAGATSAPVVIGDVLVTTTGENGSAGIRRYKAATGDLVDTKPLAETPISLAQPATRAGWDYQGPKVVFANGKLFNAPGNTVNALELESGKLQWRAAVGKAALLPPALGKQNLYVAAADGSIYVLRQADGGLVYSCSLGVGFTSPPILAGGNLYIGTSGGAVVCLKLNMPDADDWSAWGGNAQHNKVD